MTGNQAIQRVISLLDRMENDPACGPACESELHHAMEVLEASDIEVPQSLRNLHAQLAAKKRAEEEIEIGFDNMPV